MASVHRSGELTLQSAVSRDLLADFDVGDGRLLRIRKRRADEHVQGWFSRIGGRYVVVAAVSPVELSLWVDGAQVDFGAVRISAWGPLFSRVLRISDETVEADLEYSLPYRPDARRASDHPRDFGAFLARLSTDRERRERLAFKLFSNHEGLRALRVAPFRSTPAQRRYGRSR